ncbi:MAG TPA: 1,2-phenylacetyl-CoA epoxidase subunit PaaD [Nevskiaceae bacterium]|nr:1,2-phenylacetyl-CoA epoxidase subunit PaaD [Nevskiaceae bacterium]
MVTGRHAGAAGAPTGLRPPSFAAARLPLPRVGARNGTTATAVRTVFPWRGVEDSAATASHAVFSPACGREPEKGCAPARGPGSTLDQVWSWLAEVMDPEIPVLSVVDLGIVRDLHWQAGATGPELVLTWTPTYSGCPAIEVINADMRRALTAHGVDRVRLKLQLSPAWTTDWLSPAGRAKLKHYGIAPPACGACVAREITTHMARREPAVECPHCGSMHTHCLSPAGSTRCKALYVCDDCREPFDYFKVH